MTYHAKVHNYIKPKIKCEEFFEITKMQDMFDFAEHYWESCAKDFVAMISEITYKIKSNKPAVKSSINPSKGEIFESMYLFGFFLPAKISPKNQ